MNAFNDTIERNTTARTDLIDITDDVRAIIARSGVRDGIASVFVPGSTASITTIEYEPGALQDLRDAIERMAPRDMPYAHNERWGDGNGYSHVRSALLGPGIAVPIQNGAPVLGTWQQVLLCDFDNRPRARRIVVQIVGV